MNDAFDYMERVLEREMDKFYSAFKKGNKGENMAATKRWSLINKNTNNVRTSFTTRRSARVSKRPTERIFDNWTGSFVR